VPVLRISIEVPDLPGQDLLVDVIRLGDVPPKDRVSVLGGLEKVGYNVWGPLEGAKRISLVRPLETCRARLEVFDVARALGLPVQPHEKVVVNGRRLEIAEKPAQRSGLDPPLSVFPRGQARRTDRQLSSQLPKSDSPVDAKLAKGVAEHVKAGAL